MAEQYRAGNFLLDRLPSSELEQLRPFMRIVSLKLGDVLYAGFAQHDITKVYFPLSCVTSMIALMTSGDTIEAGTVGREGLAGYQVVFGTRRMLERWVCQIPGKAASIDVSELWNAFKACPNLLSTLLLYGQSLMTAVSQSVACNGLHRVEYRCAKWLLLTHDRTRTDTFELTHEYFAIMLGVRRASVSVAFDGLRKAGIIDYRRGRISIIDRARLEGASCECYANITNEYNRLMASGASYVIPSPVQNDADEQP